MRSLTDALAAMDDRIDGDEADLRLDVADLVIQALREKGWSQRDLHKASGIAEPRISGVIHSDLNLTLRTIATLAKALGFKAKIVAESTTTASTAIEWHGQFWNTDGASIGKETIKETSSQVRFFKSAATKVSAVQAPVWASTKHAHGDL